jgi:excisionase family DNA binding protein
MASEQWLTTKEVAARLRVDEETVRRWIRDKKLAGAQFGRRGGYRIASADVDRFLETQGWVPQEAPKPKHALQRVWDALAASYGDEAASRIMPTVEEKIAEEAPKKEGGE